jgi:acyl-CoA reductase-like NAD-dependent aldehyde dehydrogenase
MTDARATPHPGRHGIGAFGGVKESGVGREGVRYALEELSQLKFIGLRPSAGGA